MLGEGNCLKYLKMRWVRKEGRGKKNFKKRDKLGLVVGALKRWGWGRNPLINYANYRKFFINCHVWNRGLQN